MQSVLCAPPYMLSICSPSVKTLGVSAERVCVCARACEWNSLSSRSALFVLFCSFSLLSAPTPLAPLCYLRSLFVVLRLVQFSFPFSAQFQHFNYSFCSHCSDLVSPRPVHLYLLLPLNSHTSSCSGSAWFPSLCLAHFSVCVVFSLPLHQLVTSLHTNLL